MNKSELVDFIAGEAEISKAAAGRALDAVTTAVKKTLKKGGTVLWLASVPSLWASVQRALVVTHKLARKLKSRQLKCLSSVQVKH